MAQQQSQRPPATCPQIVPHDDSRISERHYDFSLCVFFACAVVASRRRAGRWSSPPAPRRAALALLPLVSRTRTTPPPFETLPRQHARTTDCVPTNERCDERSAGVADWKTARGGNTERTLTAAAPPPPRDPYRHSLAMRPPRKVRSFCFFNYCQKLAI